MALPEIPEISFKFVGKPDNLNTILDPDEIKAVLDAGPEEVRQAIIALTNALNSITDGASGADNIGATKISTSPTTVQGILEWLKTQIDTIIAGGVADDSVMDVKLSNAVGQIKERVTTHLADNEIHAPTFNTLKGVTTAASSYVMPGWSVGVAPTYPTITSADILYVPIFIKNPTTFDAVSIEVQTAIDGSSAEIRIYTSDDDLVPNTEVLNLGTVLTATTGVKTIATVPFTLDPGYYFVAMQFTHGVDVYGCTAATSAPPFNGRLSKGNASSAIGYSIMDGGALGTVAPTPTSVISNVPIVLFKLVF